MSCSCLTPTPNEVQMFVEFPVLAVRPSVCRLRIIPSPAGSLILHTKNGGFGKVMSLFKEPVVLNMLFIFCFLMTSEIKMVYIGIFQTKSSGWQLFHPKRSNEPSCVEPPKKKPTVPRLADGPVAEAAMAMAAKTFGTDLAE